MNEKKMNPKNESNVTLLKKELEKEGIEKLNDCIKNNKTTSNELLTITSNELLTITSNDLLKIMKEGNKTFKNTTGKNLTYLEMRELYG